MRWRIPLAAVKPEHQNHCQIVGLEIPHAVAQQKHQRGEPALWLAMLWATASHKKQPVPPGVMDIKNRSNASQAPETSPNCWCTEFFEIPHAVAQQRHHCQHGQKPALWLAILLAAANHKKATNCSQSHASQELVECTAGQQLATRMQPVAPRVTSAL